MKFSYLTLDWSRVFFDQYTINTEVNIKISNFIRFKGYGDKKIPYSTIKVTSLLVVTGRIWAKEGQKSKQGEAKDCHQKNLKTRRRTLYINTNTRRQFPYLHSFLWFHLPLAWLRSIPSHSYQIKHWWLCCVEQYKCIIIIWSQMLTQFDPWTEHCAAVTVQMLLSYLSSRRFGV